MLLTGAFTAEVAGQQFVNYCSLFDSTYEGRTVRSTALMFHSTVSRVDGADTFLYSPDCNGPDYFAIPEGDSKAWGKWKHFWATLPPEKNLVLEVTFEGKPEISTTHLFGSLDGWARAQIPFSKIFSIKDITGTPRSILANYDAARPQVERIELLKSVLQGYLLSLNDPSSTNQYVSNSLSDKFLFVDLNEKSFKKDQYLKLPAPWTELSSSVKQWGMSYRLKSKKNEAMSWRGTFELALKSGSARTYYCDLTVVLQNGNWMIRDATMVAGN